MILNTIRKVKLFQLLLRIDQDLADQQRAKNCPFCGAALHSSDYLRKPRGGPDDLSEDLLTRHSFCCSSEACRKRVLPASCRFWGRKVYWGVVILALVTLQQGRSEGYSAGKLMRLFEISRHTLKRWIHYFKKDFPLTPNWRQIRGFIGFEVPQDLIPGSLVLFLIGNTGSEEQGLIRSLQLLLAGGQMF